MTNRTATTMPTAPPAFDWTGDVAMMYLRFQMFSLNEIHDEYVTMNLRIKRITNDYNCHSGDGEDDDDGGDGGDGEDDDGSDRTDSEEVALVCCDELEGGGELAGAIPIARFHHLSICICICVFCICICICICIGICSIPIT